MEDILLILLFLIIIICLFDNRTIEGYEEYDKDEMFNNLMNDFGEIFPDRNRNAGGPQFYEHISKMNLSEEEFKLYNQFYCAVSGSPIDPKRGNVFDNIVLDDLYGNKYYGKYYRCCSPCLCDVMKYAKLETHSLELSDGNYEHHVITINDPCTNENDIPKQVTSFKCNDNKTSNGIHTDSGRLIIGIFHDVVDYDEPIHNIDQIKTNCEPRDNTEPDELRGGMGDIFVKLSLVGDDYEGFENNLLNIYGEPLQKCKTGVTPGSWDSDGYCSEKGGGVHQICFNVTDDTKDFSKDTGQSNWSESRINNNHCMCLGAWALYKAKQKNNIITGTSDELVCESIPEMSLSSDYVNKWNTWNGNELPNQIVDGVNSMVTQCYHKGNTLQKEYLKQKYISLTDNKSEFHSSETYRDMI